MSRRFKLSNEWYGDDSFKMFKEIVTLKPGLTVLVGCNGAGKTTFLKQINRKLENKEIPVIFHSNMSDGERTLRSSAISRGDFNTFARTMMSSEGENIVNVLENVATKMGMLSKNNRDAKEMWILLDAIDSGLSIDNIIELKENLIQTVIEFEKDKDVYFVISANGYELARGENCFDVSTGKYIKFNDYEEYRDFILKSREKKNLRYGEE